MHYVIILAGMMALCGSWAAFQLWLSRHDPDAGRRMQQCGNCGCQDKCEKSAQSVRPASPGFDIDQA